MLQSEQAYAGGKGAAAVKMLVVASLKDTSLENRLRLQFNLINSAHFNITLSSKNTGEHVQCLMQKYIR